MEKEVKLEDIKKTPLEGVIRNSNRRVRFNYEGTLEEFIEASPKQNLLVQVDGGAKRRGKTDWVNVLVMKEAIIESKLYVETDDQEKKGNNVDDFEDENEVTIIEANPNSILTHKNDEDFDLVQEMQSLEEEINSELAFK